MTFTVQYEYFTKNCNVPIRCSRFIDLPKWNMTEAKNKLQSVHGSNVVKIRIIGHK